MKSANHSPHLFLLFVASSLFIIANLLYGPYRAHFTIALEHVVQDVTSAIAGIFFVESKSIAELQTTYAAVPDSGRRVRILLVPGHEPAFGGTQFNGVRERDLVVELAEELQRLLQTDPHYSVSIARTTSAWHPSLAEYFSSHTEDIIDFREDHLQEMGRLVKKGLLTQVTGVSHNNAPRDVALRLYGVNAWANEQEVDIVLHLHINDHERKNTRTEGKYSGFSIYVPERQYSNSTSSRAIADALLERLSVIMSPSDMPLEKGGVVEDQELIAIGRYNTVDAPSMLIEYGYIYESQYHDEVIRPMLLREYAFQTYLGIQDFFGVNLPRKSFATTLLPHAWLDDLRSTYAPARDVLALQVALVHEQLYPPLGQTMNQCPISGRFKTCTVSALAEFQKKYNIAGEDSFVGPRTRDVLNEHYSVPE
jgi:N-acetylmuramoyl-L-alanine amidase